MARGEDYYNLYRDSDLSWHGVAHHFDVCMATPWESARRYAKRHDLPWPPCATGDRRLKFSEASKRTWNTRRKPKPEPKPEPKP